MTEEERKLIDSWWEKLNRNCGRNSEVGKGRGVGRTEVIEVTKIADGLFEEG